MSGFHIDPKYLIADELSLRAIFSDTHSLAVQKCLSALDEHSKEFIARSPFVCIGTQNYDGKADVSPRGDPVGFVKILDNTTLAIPDRPGNNRLDSLVNIVSNSNVALLFIIPGFDDTLRVNGTARLTTDPNILQAMSVKGKVPKLAIIISISEVFIHCAKAFRRSNLWNPEHLQNRSEMPSLVKIVLDQTTGAPDNAQELKTIEEELEEDYRTTMY